MLGKVARAVPVLGGRTGRRIFSAAKNQSKIPIASMGQV